MKTIKLDLDFLNGPIIKDFFDDCRKELITGVDIVDNDEEVQELNNKIKLLYSSFYNFEKDNIFDLEEAKKHKKELIALINLLISRLNSINDSSFIIDNQIKIEF